MSLLQRSQIEWLFFLASHFCEGAPGRLFEVTPSSQIVWEYVNPMFAPSGQVAGGTATGQANSIFRAHRYGPDHPALRGKDLDPSRHATLNRLLSGRT